MVGQEREGTSDKTRVGRTKDNSAATVQCKSPVTHAGAHATRVNHNGAHATRDHQGARHAHARPTEWWSAGGGRPVQRAEEWGTWAPSTRKHGEAGGGRPEGGGAWAAKTVKRPPQHTAQPRYANYWAPLPPHTAPAATSTALVHQRLGSANAETTPAGAQAAAANKMH